MNLLKTADRKMDVSIDELTIAILSSSVYFFMRTLFIYKVLVFEV